MAGTPGTIQSLVLSLGICVALCVLRGSDHRHVDHAQGTLEVTGYQCPGYKLESKGHAGRRWEPCGDGLSVLEAE